MHLSLFNKTIGFFILIVLMGCKKEELDALNEVPFIEWVQVSPTTVKELEDPIFFEFTYTDGNGDLGENEPDAKNLVLTDTRINIKYEFRIKELVPDNAEVPITGNLIFSIPNTFITNGTNSQTVSYDLYIKDRAGNISNTINSGPIVINK